MPQVHLPPFEVEKLVGVRLLTELTNWSFRHYKIRELWKSTKARQVKIAVLDTGCSHKDIVVHKEIDFSGDGIADHNGHGNWCAGCIKAGKNFLGIAPESQLYIGKILANDGSGDWKWMERGLEWALEERVQIISISAGGGYYGSKIQPILKELNNQGVIVVCAAGNENAQLIFPANSPDTLAVGAVNERWQRAVFSNYGNQLITMAPGVNLLGCWVDDGYAKLSGTSMAAPGIAGILGLQSELKTMNLEEATARFAETSRDMEEAGWDVRTGWGIIEPHKFLGLEEPKKKSWGWLVGLLFLLLLILKVPVALAKKQGEKL